MDRQTAELVAQTWWIALLGGLVSIVLGALILSIDWSVDSLALFVGIMFVLGGVSWAATRPLEGGARTGNNLLGAAGVAAGVAVMLWPEIGLPRPGTTLVVVITLTGVWSIVTGVWQCVIAFELRTLSERVDDREEQLTPRIAT